jgi:hypothetical protein
VTDLGTGIARLIYQIARFIRRGSAQPVLQLIGSRVSG